MCAPPSPRASPFWKPRESHSPTPCPCQESHGASLTTANSADRTASPSGDLVPLPCCSTVCSCEPRAPGQAQLPALCSLAFMGHSRHPTPCPSPPPWGSAACPGCAQGLWKRMDHGAPSPGGSAGQCLHGVALMVRVHMTPLSLPTSFVPLGFPSGQSALWKEDPEGPWRPGPSVDQWGGTPETAVESSPCMQF